MQFKSFFLIALFIANHSQAQTIKMQGGLSFSNLNWSLEDYDHTTKYQRPIWGHSGFIGIDYGEHDNYNFSSNIGLVRRGGFDKFPKYDANGNSTGQYNTIEATLNYVSFNTCIDLLLSEGEVGQRFLSIGPKVDYLYKYSKELDPIRDMKALKYFSTGFVIGIGGRYNIHNFQIGLRTDYYANANLIADWAATDNQVGGSIRSHNLTINLTVGYRLKEKVIL